MRRSCWGRCCRGAGTGARRSLLLISARSRVHGGCRRRAVSFYSFFFHSSPGSATRECTKWQSTCCPKNVTAAGGEEREGVEGRDRVYDGTLVMPLSAQRSIDRTRGAGVPPACAFFSAFGAGGSVTKSREVVPARGAESECMTCRDPLAPSADRPSGREHHGWKGPQQHVDPCADNPEAIEALDSDDPEIGRRGRAGEPPCQADVRPTIVSGLPTSWLQRGWTIRSRVRDYDSSAEDACFPPLSIRIPPRQPPPGRRDRDGRDAQGEGDDPAAKP